MLCNRNIILTGLCASLMSVAGCPPQDEPPSVGNIPVPANVQRSPGNGQPSAVAVPESDPVVATIDGVTVTMGELTPPLVDAFGLNMLLKVVELELAKQQAGRLGMMVTASDVSAERQRYIDQVFKDDKRIAEMRDQMDEKTRQGKPGDAETLRKSITQEQQRLLAQLLDNQKLTRIEFDLAMETTVYLRAIVQPAVVAKLTDDNLQESFRARYGEKVQVRHIACANLQEIAEAKRRLAAGESFSQVAQELSRNRQSGALGGEIMPFSRSTPGLPQAFKEAAFALQKSGDISDPVEADGAYHLIQLQDRIAPTAVKFEDVKDSVRQDLAEALTQASVRQLRVQLGQQALKDLKIQNPVLAKQFEDKVTQRDTDIRDRDQIRQQLKSERGATPAVPAPVPGSMPTPTPAPMPGSTPAPMSAMPATGSVPSPAAPPAAATEPVTVHGPAANGTSASTSASTRP